MKKMNETGEVENVNVNETGSSDDDDLMEIPDTGEAIEPFAVEAGEKKLEIIGCMLKVPDNGDPFMMPMFKIVEPAAVGAANLTYYMCLPNHETQDDDTYNRNNLKKQRFCKAFKLPTSGTLRKSEMIGRQAWALVSKETSKNPDYGDADGMVNNIKRWL